MLILMFCSILALVELNEHWLNVGKAGTPFNPDADKVCLL